MPDDSRRTQPSILILNNENPAWWEPDLLDAREMLKILQTGLAEQGFSSEPYVYFDDLSGLERYSPQDWLVWNWGEELAGQPWSDALVTDELERLGFTYTGSGSEVLRLVQDRVAVKRRLEAAGLPTPPWRLFTDPAQAAEWNLFPAMVKGANQHASYGIDRNALVMNTAELAARIAFLRSDFQDDALVEPFLDTREFHVSVWGNQHPQALPPLELDYTVFDDVRDRLYTYEWKFNVESRGFIEMKLRCPAPLDRPDWQPRLEALAVEAHRTLGLRDFSRVDLRMLGNEPQILDVNANPDLNLVSETPISCKAVGISHGQMFAQIVRFALERFPAAQPAH